MIAPTDFKSLSTPKIWILYAGSTIHNALHTIGMTNVRQGTNKDDVTTVNGEIIQSESMRIIKGVVTTKTGSTLEIVTLKDLSYGP